MEEAAADDIQESVLLLKQRLAHALHENEAFRDFIKIPNNLGLDGLRRELSQNRQDIMDLRKRNAQLENDVSVLQEQIRGVDTAFRSMFKLIAIREKSTSFQCKGSQTDEKMEAIYIEELLEKTLKGQDNVIQVLRKMDVDVSLEMQEEKNNKISPLAKKWNNSEINTQDSVPISRQYEHSIPELHVVMEPLRNNHVSEMVNPALRFNELSQNSHANSNIDEKDIDIPSPVETKPEPCDSPEVNVIDSPEEPSYPTNNGTLVNFENGDRLNPIGIKRASLSGAVIRSRTDINEEQNPSSEGITISTNLYNVRPLTFVGIPAPPGVLRQGALPKGLQTAPKEKVVYMNVKQAQNTPLLLSNNRKYYYPVKTRRMKENAKQDEVLDRDDLYAFLNLPKDIDFGSDEQFRLLMNKSGKKDEEEGEKKPEAKRGGPIKRKHNESVIDSKDTIVKPNVTTNDSEEVPPPKAVEVQCERRPKRPRIEIKHK